MLYIHNFNIHQHFQHLNPYERIFRIVNLWLTFILCHRSEYQEFSPGHPITACNIRIDQKWKLETEFVISIQIFELLCMTDTPSSSHHQHMELQTFVEHDHHGVDNITTSSSWCWLYQVIISTISWSRSLFTICKHSLLTTCKLCKINTNWADWGPQIDQYWLTLLTTTYQVLIAFKTFKQFQPQ